MPAPLRRCRHLIRGGAMADDNDLSGLTTLMWGGIGAAFTALSSAVGILYKRNQVYAQAEARCLARVASLEAQLVSMNVQLELSMWQGAVVVADATTGIIQEWNSGATLLLHWTVKDMLGKSVTKIMPARFRDKYNEAITAMNKSGRLPYHGPYEFMALTKEGIEIPVEIRLSGWAIGQQRMMGAAIRHRISSDEIPVITENL